MNDSPDDFNSPDSLVNNKNKPLLHPCDVEECSQVFDAPHKLKEHYEKVHKYVTLVTLPDGQCISVYLHLHLTSYRYQDQGETCPRLPLLL